MEGYVAEGYSWTMDHLSIATAVLAVIVLIVGGLYVHSREKKGTSITGTSVGDLLMFTMHRELELMQHWSDVIEQGGDKLLADGKITKAELRVWKRRFANILELKDLLPKGQLTLRETIRGRLKHMDKTPVPIPGVATPIAKTPSTKKAKDLRSIFQPQT